MTTIDLYTYSDRDPKYNAPRIMFQYLESDTGIYWTIWASAGYAYLYRIGDRLNSIDLAARKNDAEIMIRRLQACLLISKKGRFRYNFDSMWTLDNITIEPELSTVNCVLPYSTSEEYDQEVPDWYGVLSRHDLLKRAAEDAYLASVFGQESIIFLYRAFEWLKKAANNISWAKLGEAIDVPQENIENIKKLAHNPEAASRHAVESGKKARFEGEICSSWVCGIFHAIVHLRRSLEPDFDTKVKKDGDPWPI